mgnify:CR=1 FL=1
MHVYAPRDATTNPSLIRKAVQKAEYLPLLEQAVNLHAGKSIAEIIDHLLISFDKNILEIVPGRLSTETDTRLFFATGAPLSQGHHLIAFYDSA